MGIISSDKLQDYAGCFSTEDDLTYVEIWNFQDDRKRIWAQGPVVIDEFGCLKQGHCYDDAIEGLVIIFSEGISQCWDDDPHGSRVSQAPMRMRSKTFESIAEAFSLSEVHLQMMNEASTVFIDTQNILVGKSQDVLTFMMQNSFTSSSQFSTSLSYCPKRHLTKALLHGLSKPEQVALVEELKNYRNDIGLPMLLPLLLLTFRFCSATRKVRDCHLEIVEIERKTGIQTKWHIGEPCCSGVNKQQKFPTKRYEALDFDQTTADLTSLNAKLAYVEYVCEVHLPMLHRIDVIHSQIVDGIMDPNTRMRLQQGTLVRAKYLSKRGQGQVQTLYSLIAQKDNALSIRDNNQLKIISEDQKRIALLATKDSAAMRVISAITAVLLPATFTATLFSTTFFDFQAGYGEHVLVSKWIWLYITITVLLSGLFIAWWRYLSVQKQHILDKEFETDNREIPDSSVKSDNVSGSTRNEEKTF